MILHPPISTFPRSPTIHFGGLLLKTFHWSLLCNFVLSLLHISRGPLTFHFLWPLTLFSINKPLCISFKLLPSYHALLASVVDYVYPCCITFTLATCSTFLLVLALHFFSLFSTLVWCLLCISWRPTFEHTFVPWTNGLLNFIFIHKSMNIN